MLSVGIDSVYFAVFIVGRWKSLRLIIVLGWLTFQVQLTGHILIRCHFLTTPTPLNECCSVSHFHDYYTWAHNKCLKEHKMTEKNEQKLVLNGTRRHTITTDCHRTNIKRQEKGELAIISAKWHVTNEGRWKQQLSTDLTSPKRNRIDLTHIHILRI